MSGVEIRVHRLVFVFLAGSSRFSGLLFLVFFCTFFSKWHPLHVWKRSFGKRNMGIGDMGCAEDGLGTYLQDDYDGCFCFVSCVVRRIAFLLSLDGLALCELANRGGDGVLCGQGIECLGILSILPIPTSC